MTPILFDYAEQRTESMNVHPKEIGFTVNYGPLKVVVAVLAIIVVSLILMKF